MVERCRIVEDLLGRSSDLYDSFVNIVADRKIFLS